VWDKRAARGRVMAASRRPSRRAPSWQVGGLVSFVLTLLVVGDLPVVHDHDKPGLYNEECSLARLADGAPRAPVSSGPAPMLLLLAPDTLPVSVRAVVVFVGPASFDPRAPPFAHRSLFAH